MERGAVRVDDAELAWSSIGDGPKTIVLIMGLGGWSGDWGSEFTAPLANEHRVVLFDNRGTGTSSRSPGPYSLEQLARDAAAVIEQVAGERAHVLGVSMGGMIAQLVALEHSRRVDRLVLMSTHCGGARALMPLPHVLPTLFPTPGTPADVIVRTRMSAIAAPGWAENNPRAVEDRVHASLRAPTPTRTYRAQLDAIMQSDRYTRLDEIDAPTLVVHGDVDALIPYGNGELLARQIPNAKLHTLRGVGHLPMWEAPEQTAGAVIDFLR